MGFSLFFEYLMQNLNSRNGPFRYNHISWVSTAL